MLVLSQLKNDVIAVLSEGNSQDSLVISSKNDVTRIMQNNQVIGFNFINLKLVSDLGLITQTPELIKQLNDLIDKAGFDDELEIDDTPKFVVATVKKMQALESSNHLKVVDLDLGEGQSTKVVSGSPNMQENIKVIAVRPGAMMPSGQIIFAGQLHGIDSDGMIASARELKIKNAPDKPGALILSENWPQSNGDEFNFEEAQKIYG